MLRSLSLIAASGLALAACASDQNLADSRIVRGAAVGALGGAAVGAVVPGVSTAEGAAIGAAGGAVVGAVKDGDRTWYRDEQGRRYYLDRDGRRVYRD
jgi:hypothetical protein